MILDKFFFALCFARLAVDHVLGSELSDLEFSAELKISVLATHASVEQLVEVNISVIRSNSHFQHNFPNVVVRHLLRKSDRSRKLPEKVEQLLFPHFYALVFETHHDPGPLKDVVVFLELADWIVIRHVVHFKLVDDNKGEQVNHNELYRHHECDEE